MFWKTWPAIFRNCGMRLSRICRILQINSRGCYPQIPKAEVDNTLRDLQNSSYPTNAALNNCFIIHSKYFPALKGVSPFRSLFFRSPNITTLSPGFLGQRFNNLQRAALLTSFWHRFNNFRRAALLTSLVPYLVNSNWLWWIIRVASLSQCHFIISVMYRLSYDFELNLKLICTSAFFKKLKLHFSSFGKTFVACKFCTKFRHHFTWYHWLGKCPIVFKSIITI